MKYIKTDDNAEALEDAHDKEFEKFKHELWGKHPGYDGKGWFGRQKINLAQGGNLYILSSMLREGAHHDAVAQLIRDLIQSTQRIEAISTSAARVSGAPASMDAGGQLKPSYLDNSIQPLTVELRDALQAGGGITLLENVGAAAAGTPDTLGAEKVIESYGRAKIQVRSCIQTGMFAAVMFAINATGSCAGDHIVANAKDIVSSAGNFITKDHELDISHPGFVFIPAGDGKNMLYIEKEPALSQTPNKITLGFLDDQRRPVPFSIRASPSAQTFADLTGAIQTITNGNPNFFSHIIKGHSDPGACKADAACGQTWKTFKDWTTASHMTLSFVSPGEPLGITNKYSPQNHSYG